MFRCVPERHQPVFFVGVLGVAFFLLFVAFNGVQVLVTTLSKDLGFETLMTLYAVFAVSNFLCPVVIHYLGHRWAMFVGSLAYILFIGANLKPIAGLMFPASVLLGMGAALLWSAQGGYLARWSNDENLGMLSGLFFGLFMLNLVAGNLISSAVLHSSLPSYWLFVIFLIIGSVGASGLLLLRPAPVSAKDVDKGPPSVRSLLLSTLSLFADRRMLLFLPIMIFSGLSQEYFFGSFTGGIGRFNPALIGYVMAVFGGTEVLGSLVSGRLSDYTGRLPVLVAMAVIQTGGIVMSVFASEDRQGLYFGAAALMGLGDALLNTQIYAVLGFVFPASSEAAFSMFKMMQAFHTAIAFLYGRYLSIQGCALVLLCVGFVGMVAVLVLGLCVAPIDQRRARAMGMGAVEDNETAPLVVNQGKEYA